MTQTRMALAFKARLCKTLLFYAIFLESYNQSATWNVGYSDILDATNEEDSIIPLVPLGVSAMAEFKPLTSRPMVSGESSFSQT